MVDHTEFHVAEYEALRSEILTHIRDVRIMQRGSLLGIALFYAWYSSSGETIHSTVIQLVLLWLPLAVLYFVARLSIMKIDTVHEAGRYIAKPENTLAHPAIKGWENHLTELRKLDPTAVKADRVDKWYWLTIGLAVLVVTAFETVTVALSLFSS
ncbi:MAG: hypothetical protein ACX939_05375 [Hyphococcus sp.]